MKCIKFSKITEKLKTIRIPVIFTVLFVLYYAFGSFIQNEFVFSEAGKEATGLLLSYSVIAFFGINLFAIVRTQKEIFKSTKLLYFTLLVGALVIFFIYTILIASLISAYASSIAIKLQMVSYYFTQLAAVNVGNLVTNTIIFMLFISSIVLLTIAIVIVCWKIKMRYCNIDLTFVAKKESISETDFNIKKESLGFLYFALS